MQQILLVHFPRKHRIVRDQYERTALLATNPHNQIHHFGSRVFIEVARRFIRKNNWGKDRMSTREEKTMTNNQIPITRETDNDQEPGKRYRQSVAPLPLFNWLLVNWALFSIGAGDGARTRGIKLGKLALYQLSYARTEV